MPKNIIDGSGYYDDGSSVLLSESKEMLSKKGWKLPPSQPSPRGEGAVSKWH
jgi:hypothetical protein